MRYSLFISAVVLIFCSCTNNSRSTLEIFRTSEAGFRTSTEAISSSNMQIYRALASRVSNTNYRKADIWNPKALQIHLISDNIAQYINGLRNYLKKEAGSYKKDEIEFYNEESTNAVHHLAETKAGELFDRLVNYRKDILAVDSLMKNEFEHTVRLFSPSFDYSKAESKEFTRTFFNGIPAIAAMTILSKFENDIKVNENRFVTFCLDQTHAVGGYTVVVPLIQQSSNCVKTGDEIIITAAIGALSFAAQPKTTIDGKDIQLDPDGAAIYKFKTPSKAGRYSKAVKMEYTNPDGTTQSMTKNIEYTVIDPNQK